MMVSEDETSLESGRRPPIPFTLRQMECFLAVASGGSIAAAALTLNASDSAVSDALTAMERALGTRLFNRRRAHGATLTSDGIAIVPIVQRMLVDAEALAATVGRGTGAMTGPVRIGALGTLAPVILPRLIHASALKHPGVRIDYRTDDQPALLEQLAGGELDLVLTYDIDVPPELRRQSLYSTEACLLIDASHPLAHTNAISLEQLAHEPMVLLDISSSRIHTLELMSSRSITPHIAFRTDNYELCRSLVGRGLGYSLLMRRTIDEHTWDGGEVVFVPITPPPRSVDVLLLWSTAIRAPRISATVELANDVFRRA